MAVARWKSCQKIDADQDTHQLAISIAVCPYQLSDLTSETRSLIVLAIRVATRSAKRQHQLVTLSQTLALSQTEVQLLLYRS